MKNNKTGHEIKPEAEGIAFWLDSNTRHTTLDHEGNFIFNAVDAPEAEDVITMWDNLHIDWACVGPHRFKAGDRIILFNYREEEPTTVDLIEVIEVGPLEIKVPDSDFSHFIAYRKLKGYAPVELSLDHVLELRSQGLIMSVADLQRRQKLSQEEWDQFVRILKLCQEQPETEKQPNGKIS